MNNIHETNMSLSQSALEDWAKYPPIFCAYYNIPSESPRPGRLYRREFAVNCEHATVTLWTGEPIGRILRARVYTSSIGGRIVTMIVQGTNGYRYHGRASWDNGNAILLRRMK